MSSKKVEEVKKQYQFKEGARYSVPADVVGEVLEKIHATEGVVTAKAVVEHARPENAPLHPVFEWDDGKAAEKHRQWQARCLVKAVLVVSSEVNDETGPAYINVRAVSGSVPRGYQPVDVVVARHDMYAAALADLSAKVAAAWDSVEALRRAAEQSPTTDADRLGRITVALHAVQVASTAVAALH